MFIEVPYFKYYKDYQIFYFNNIEKFKRAGIELKIFDGIPGSLLNGGRNGIKDGIPAKKNLNFVLTSSTFTKEDLEKDIAFEILKEYDDQSNAIITGSFDILKKAKSLYKNIKYIFSITAYDIIGKSAQDVLDFYQNIEQHFDYIVPRVEVIDILGNRLEELNLKQYIFLESYECYGCPLYMEHFKVISTIDKGEAHPKFGNCWIKDKRLLKDLNIQEPDYQYKTSEKTLPKTFKLPVQPAGYKIGRNNQPFETILEDIHKILDNVIKEKYA